MLTVDRLDVWNEACLDFVPFQRMVVMFGQNSTADMMTVCRGIAIVYERSKLFSVGVMQFWWSFVNVGDGDIIL